MYTGTKSEGLVSFLLIDENKEYRLYRTDVYPINDSYFSPFDGKMVSVDGEIENDSFFCVTSIEEIQIEDDLL